MSNVFVVGRGEYGEGQLPERAFSSLDGAKDWVQRHYDVRPTAVGAGTWRAIWNGCDEIWIYRMKVWDL